MEIFELAVVISLVIAGIAVMILCRTLNQKDKSESDEIEPELKDVDLPEPPEQEKKEDLPAKDLRRWLAGYQGSHRRAIISSVIRHKKPVARYETVRGGWSWAEVITVHQEYVLLRRQGTEFIRSLA